MTTKVFKFLILTMVRLSPKFLEMSSGTSQIKLLHYCPIHITCTKALCKMAGGFVLHFFLMLWNNSSSISDVLKETHFFNHQTRQVFVTLHIKWVRVTLSAVQTQTFVTNILPQLLLLFRVRIKQVEAFLISLQKKKSFYAELCKFHFAHKNIHVEAKHVWWVYCDYKT
jgi:hypothetical protein